MPELSLLRRKFFFCERRTDALLSLMDFAVFGCEPLGCSALLGSKNSFRNWSVSVLDSGSATAGTGN